MGGCGTFAAGNAVDYVYETAYTIEDAKVLVGKAGKGKHALPEESHSPSAKYIKMNGDTFREMRIYEEHKIVLEIGFHHEKALRSDLKPVLHYHEYPDGTFGSRSKAIPMPPEMIEKYKKYLKGVKL